MYLITGRGGLYPEGCAFKTRTANGALERYRAVRVACGCGVVRDGSGKQLSVPRLVSLAEDELTSEV
jgi:hypothetical protein